MRRTAIFLLCLVLVCSLAGCGQASTAPSTQQATVPTTTAEIEPPAPLSDEALIAALTEYIKEIWWECEVGVIPFTETLDRIRSGKTNGYLAITDEDAYYYMCAYYTSDEDDFDFPNVDDYTWVKFSSEAEITEYYDELTFMIGFQINGMQFCTNLKNDEEVSMEYCQRYKPVFADGFNTAVPLACDVCLLITGGRGPLYHIRNSSRHTSFANCVEVDGQFYIKQHVYTEYNETAPAHTSFYRDLESEWGDYYDALMNAMGSELYVETTSNADVYYGYISIEALKEIIRN